MEKKLSAQWVEAAELEVRDAERLLSSQAQVLGVKLLAVRQQKALREQQVALAGKLSEFASRRAKDGEISALDAAQIEVDGQRLQLESRRLDTEAASLIGELKPLLGLQPEVPLEVTGELVEMNMPGAAMAWQQRADYQLALKKAESTTTEIDLAKAKRYGDLSTGLFTAREWQRDSGDRENTGYVGLRVSIPWPLWNRNEGEIAEKTAGSKRAQLEAVAMAAQIVNEVDSARREMKAHADLLLESKGKLLPLLTDHAAKLEKAYQSGQADLIALERARDQRLQVESSTIDTLRDFHLARIRYETAIGKHATAAAKH